MGASETRTLNQLRYFFYCPIFVQFGTFRDKDHVAVLVACERDPLSADRRRHGRVNRVVQQMMVVQRGPLSQRQVPLEQCLSASSNRPRLSAA